MFQIFYELDTEDVQKKGGITFDEFIKSIEKKLGNKDTKEGIRNIFNLFGKRFIGKSCKNNNYYPKIVFEFWRNNKRGRKIYNWRFSKF